MWKTKTGELIKISEMETSHIENSIAMLERNSVKGALVEYAMFDAEDLTADLVKGQDYLDITKYAELTEELNRRPLLTNN